MNFERQSVEEQETKRMVDPEKIIEFKCEGEETDIPIVCAPGWGIVSEQTKENFFKPLSDGRSVYSLDFPRKNIISKKDQEEISKNLIAEYSVTHLQKALALIDMMDQKDIEKADAAVYSEGGITIAIAAALFPERFRNIVLIDPAGMIGKGSALKLAWRFKKEGDYLKRIKKEEAARKNKGEERNKADFPEKEMINLFIKYIKSNAGLALQEIGAMSKTDIYELLKHLKSNGIEIAMIVGAHDKVFPSDKIQDRYGQEQRKVGESLGIIKDDFENNELYQAKLREAEIYSKYLTGVYVTDTAHDETSGIGKLEMGKLAEIVKIILEDLENKRQKSLASYKKGWLKY